MILLTGASGFIGSSILKSLIDKYGSNNVVALTSKPLEGCQYLLHNNYTFENDFFIKNGFDAIEIIVHAGAFIPKEANEVNAILKCNGNITSSFALISSKLPLLKKIVFLSTIDVYKDSNKPISELSEVKPQTLYGASKLYCESMINAWAAQYNIESIILRIGHVFGPGEHEYKKLIPEIMRNIIHGNELIIWGSGEDIRSFIYIDDVTKAILCSIEDKIEGSTINVVGSIPITIRQVIDIIIKTSGKNIIPRKIASNHQRRDLIFENSLMTKHLYSPNTSFEEGIKKEWDALKLVYEKNNI
jgi:nucleoside-diphosphate-sugar epimerase